MAGLNINDSFEIDAAKLLAKLHRGACEVQAEKGMKFFNAGVIDDAEIKPSECEKSTISFDTSLTQIELGVIAHPKIECKLKHTAYDILEKATDVKKKEDEKAKITDNPDKKTNESGIPSFLQFMREDDNRPAGKDDKKEDKTDIDVDPFQVPKGIDDEARPEVEKMVKENQDDLKKKIDAELKFCAEVLQQYMKEFAGEAESKKITEKSVTAVYLPDGVDPTKFKYKDGVIEGIKDEERKRDWQEQLKKKPDTDVYVIKNLCCKMAYTLNMEA